MESESQLCETQKPIQAIETTRIHNYTLLHFQYAKGRTVQREPANLQQEAHRIWPSTMTEP